MRPLLLVGWVALDQRDLPDDGGRLHYAVVWPDFEFPVEGGASVAADQMRRDSRFALADGRAALVTCAEELFRTDDSHVAWVRNAVGACANDFSGELVRLAGEDVHVTGESTTFPSPQFVADDGSTAPQAWFVPPPDVSPRSDRRL